MFTSFLGEQWATDASTIAILAVVLWLDGWRRAPSETLVLVRVGLGSWKVRHPWARVGPFALIGWWPPIVLPMLVSTGGQESLAGSFDDGVVDGRNRLRRVRARLISLRLLGTIIVGWIVFGIPLFTARFGASGLLRGIAVAFVFAALATAQSTFLLVSLALPWRTALKRSAPLLSPFSAVRAPEVVLGAALDPLHPLARIAVLLGETELRAWLRPYAYDALHGRAGDPLADPSGVATLVSDLPRSVLERASAASPPNASAEAYCPRCGRTYRADVETCSECADLALVR
jgi:hypothetical protein